MKTYYSETLHKKVTVPDDTVEPGLGCPKCAEDRYDWLAWVEPACSRSAQLIPTAALSR